jgi:glycine cleavage system transcriptional repressor
LLVSAIGEDRIGIVSDISQHVSDVGGNVGESQAARLGNHFSIMMLVNVPADGKAALEDKLKKLDGLQANVFETKVEQAEFTPKVACKLLSACFMVCVLRVSKVKILPPLFINLLLH